MKRLLMPAVALIILAMASCSKPTPATDSVQTPAYDSLGESNKALVKKLINAVCTADTTSMGDFLADDYMQHGPAIKDSLNKEQDLNAWKKNWREQYRSIKYDQAAGLAYTVTPEMNARVAGDWVMEWGTISVAYKNGMLPVKFNIHLTMRITNGKVDREYVYYNVADILAQQGFTFVPPQAKKGAK